MRRLICSSLTTGGAALVAANVLPPVDLGKPLLVMETRDLLVYDGTPFGGELGDRLARVMGVAPCNLAGHFDLVHLLDRWFEDGDTQQASRAAFRLITERGFAPAGTIFAGQRVARAFMARPPGRSLATVGPCVWFPFMVAGGPRCAVLPHPSGVERWYTDPANVARARAFLRDAAGLTP